MYVHSPVVVADSRADPRAAHGGVQQHAGIDGISGASDAAAALAARAAGAGSPASALHIARYAYVAQVSTNLFFYCYSR